VAEKNEKISMVNNPKSVLMKFKRGYYHFRVTSKHFIFIICPLWLSIFLHSIKMVIAPFEFHQYLVSK
jgi:hypothetical protein